MKYPFATMTVLGLLGTTAITPALAVNSSVESALASDGDVSLFYQAFHNTGVANELNENTEYTVFAPTNAAFAEIPPSVYPCFYAAQCRVEVAAILRNHIVPRNESIASFSKWGGDIPTIGNDRLYVEEAYIDDYTVEGHKVLNQSEGNKVSLYRIDGVIASDQELAQFQRQPVAGIPGTVTEKTVTTYRTPVAYATTYPAASGTYAVPGGYPMAPAVYVAPGDLPDNTTQTTTVTHTTTTESQ